MKEPTPRALMGQIRALEKTLSKDPGYRKAVQLQKLKRRHREVLRASLKVVT